MEISNAKSCKVQSQADIASLASTTPRGGATVMAPAGGQSMISLKDSPRDSEAKVTKSNGISIMRNISSIHFAFAGGKKDKRSLQKSASTNSLNLSQAQSGQIGLPKNKNRSSSRDSSTSMSQSMIVNQKDDKALGLLFYSQEIQVKVKYGEHSTNVKFSPVTEVSAVLKLVVKALEIEPVESSKISSTFFIGKRDRQNPGCRIWLQSDIPISATDLQQGDELILKRAAATEIMKFIMPPTKSELSFDYTHKMLVSDAIDSLKISRNGQDKVYGLYNARYGMWLDRSKTLSSYDLEDHTLEFRTLVDEMLIRVHIADYDQKIAIRVLPTFKVSDIISMIKNQMLNRQLKAINIGMYGLFIPCKSEWMRLDANIEEYPIIKTEPISYKVHKHICTVKIEHQEYLQLYIDESSTIEDLYSLFLINYCIALESDYGVYSLNGDLIPMESLIINIVGSGTMGESLLIKMKPLSVNLTSPSYPETNITIELDKGLSLTFYLSEICRRFGFPVELFEKITIKGSEIKMNVPISRIKWNCNDMTFCVHFRPFQELNPRPLRSPSPPKREDGVSTYSLTQLIDKICLASAEQGSQYLDFVKTFLLTYPSFTTLNVILERLRESYFVLNENDLSWTDFENYRKPIRIRIGNFILQLTKRCYYDIHHDSNFQQILHFINNVIALDNGSLAKQIKKSLEKLQERRDSPMELMTGRIESTQNLDDIFTYSVEEIAQQLTLIEASLFQEVTHSQLLGQAWSKTDAIEKAPAIIKLSRRFNSIADWVQQSVLELKTPKLRGERLAKFIDITQHLLNLRNYSTIMAIICGLNKASVSRLKLSFRELNSKSLRKKDEMENLMSAKSSYKNYRASLHSIQPPCIPYIGTYLIDLTYIEEGNENILDGAINFSKRELISKIIREISEYQQASYNECNCDRLLQQKLINLPESSAAKETRFWKKSKELE